MNRVVGPWGALSLVAGSMLGVGIFLAPGQMAAHISSPGTFLGVWAFAGLVVAGGAVGYAALAVRYPEAGGDYVYLRAAFGASVAFAAGWALVAGIFAGSLAAVAEALCRFQLAALLGWDASAAVLGPLSGAQLGWAAVVLGLTVLNVAGMRISARLQTAATLGPVAVLVGVALWGLVAGAATPTPAAPRPLSASGLVEAYLLTYFAYSGWNSVVYTAGEVRDPERTLPRALLGGTALVTALYLLLCLAFLAVLGLGGAAAAVEAGSALARSLWGDTGGVLMNVLIAVCLVATLNATIAGGARVAFAMAHDGAFWRGADRLSPTGVPAVALWLQAGWAVALVLSHQAEALMVAASLTMLLTGGLAVLSVFRLGLRAPLGHPWLPGLYLLASAAALVVQAASGDVAPLIGVGVFLVALAAHRLLGR